MTRCPALVYENTEVVIMQTDEKTFADKFLYPVCNLWAESLSACKGLAAIKTHFFLAVELF